jgi:hypothetical protein
VILFGVSGLMPENAESFRAFPDLCPGVANAGLGEGIAFDLDRELEGLTNKVSGALVGVFDGFDILNTFKRVGTTVMENGNACLWVGLRYGPVPAGEEFETAACRRNLAYLPWLANQHPRSNQVFGELRRRSGRSGLVPGTQNDDRRWECKREQTEGASPDDVTASGGGVHGIFVF